jgi:hypothetical protein
MPTSYLRVNYRVELGSHFAAVIFLFADTIQENKYDSPFIRGLLYYCTVECFKREISTQLQASKEKKSLSFEKP